MEASERFLDCPVLGIAARLGLGCGLVTLGLLAVSTGQVTLQGQTWLDGSAIMPYFVRIIGALLVAFGVMTLLPISATQGASAAGGVVLAWVAAVSMPTTLIHPANVAGWLGPTELFVIGMGLRVSGLLGQGKGALWQRWRDLVRFALGPCFVVFGVSHFVYLDFTAGMIPSLLPFHTGLAALTGALHIAIGLGLMLSKTARLAIGIGAAMMSSFVLLVHIPGTVTSGAEFGQLVMLAKALLLASAAWTLAHNWNRGAEAAL